ncbi:M48 family metalloprotease [Halovenus sp. WSH3]|uniref:Protease HtpX homolog n=1 Tax=Halovenus carboxidivorans TaxID=2692199 RepID=A0A6B0SYD3_9EURY|nr:M48 family metalloprotease [Halovenus carboxidivorans]MXR50177.1 M48 family metalloprotease [Halovenus carboxidivorans]
MEWETDRSLQLRMAATLGLIAVLPLAFTFTLTAALNYVVLPMASEGGSTPQIGYDPLLVLALTGIGIGLAAVSGDRLALNSTGAQTVSAEEYPNLHARLQRLAATADLPKPEVAVIDSDAPNAFATGSLRGGHTVAVTTGLLDSLDGDELDAVLAHELSHVHNRDATVMSIAYLLPTLTYLVSKTMFGLLHVLSRVLIFTPGHGGGRDRDSGGRAILVVVAAAVVTITVSAVFWLASNVLFRILSQYREYAADRGSAAITGDPAALASALAVIDGEMAAMPGQDLRDLDGGAEALYIYSIDTPLFDDEDDTIADDLLSQELFPASHPPTDERIERLQELAGDLET